MNFFTKQKEPHRHRKQTLLPKGKGSGMINQEVGINIYTLLYIKQITNKDLLYSKEKYTQQFVITYKRKESEKEDMYVCITESLCCTPETNTTLKKKHIMKRGKNQKNWKAVAFCFIS